MTACTITWQPLAAAITSARVIASPRIEVNPSRCSLACSALLGLVVVCAVLLTLALVTTTWVARRMGFSKEDEITLVFCGSKKSLASGVPMAKVLFASSTVGMMVLPLMLFHQMQLMVCAVLAAKYAQRKEAAALA